MHDASLPLLRLHVEAAAELVHVVGLLSKGKGWDGGLECGLRGREGLWVEDSLFGAVVEGVVLVHSILKRIRIRILYVMNDSR